MTTDESRNTNHPPQCHAPCKLSDTSRVTVVAALAESYQQQHLYVVVFESEQYLAPLQKHRTGTN